MRMTLPRIKQQPKSHEVPDPPRKVLYVEGNADGTIGGSHTSLLNLIRGLDKTKYKPVVLFFCRHQLIAEFIAAGAEVHILSRPSPFTFALKSNEVLPDPLRRILNIPVSLVRKALNLVTSLLLYGIVRAMFFLRRNEIDLVHLNNGIPVCCEWHIAAKLLGIKSIAHQRGIIPFYLSWRLMVRTLDAAISVSNAVKENMERRGAICRNNVVVYDALPEEFLTQHCGCEREAQPLRRDPRVGIIGNIKRWKGQRVVVEALTLLTQKYPGIQCLIIGEAGGDSMDYLDEVTSLIAEKGLRDNVIFTGYRPDIPSVLSSLDVIIHASIQPEPFGMVIIEGMSMGKPVIATNIGAPREIIRTGETGLLVPPDNPPELARAIDWALSHHSEAAEMGKRGCEIVKERFTVEENVAKTEAVYEAILAGSSGLSQSQATGPAGYSK